MEIDGFLIILRAWAMVFNKKKAKEQAIDELQRLQSELESLRTKQLNALESQLQAVPCRR